MRKASERDFERTALRQATETVSHDETLNGWLMMVRNSKNSRRGSKRSGDRWRWSWFDAADHFKTAATDYKSECQS
jgi:hypothetical protein